MKKTIITLVLCSFLSACGGGGDAPTPTPPPPSTGISPPTTIIPPSPTSSTTTTPTPTQPPTTPTPIRPDPYALHPGAELAPSAPQPGSTAANPQISLQGIYHSFWGMSFIDSKNNIVEALTFDSIFGSITAIGNTWTFNKGTYTHDGIRSPTEVVSGGGSFAKNGEIKGSFNLENRKTPNDFIRKFSESNNLAVTQTSVTGQWTIDNISGSTFNINVSNDGAVTGTLKKAGDPLQVQCTVTGNIVHELPNTAHNMYKISLTFSDVKNCSTETGNTYVGLAAIHLRSAGTYVGNGYFRDLNFIIKTSADSTISGAFKKQPSAQGQTK